MTEDVPTDRRSTVRVLVRLGTPFGGEPTQRRMGGYLVIILGEAKPDDWRSSRMRLGDLEGIVWTTPRQVPTVVNNLRACDGVIDVHGESNDPPAAPPGPPPRSRPRG